MMIQPVNFVPTYSTNWTKPMVAFAVVALLDHNCRIVAALLVAVVRDRMSASDTNMERTADHHRRRRHHRCRWPYCGLIAPCQSNCCAAAAAVPDHNNGNRFDC